MQGGVVHSARSVTLIATALLIILGAGNSSGQKKAATVWPAGDIKWMEMKGLPPGEKHPLHVHTNDVSLVVISGTFLYTPEGGMEQRLGPGSYLDVPAGLKHLSGTSEDGPCEVFQTSTGKFDMMPVDKMTKK
jgi:quercetin dioxygenase-like cupin family protein